MIFFSNNLNRYILPTLVGLLLLALVPTTSFAQFNPEINYQGKLTNASGVAVPDGLYNMNFWLVPTDVGATSTAVWSEVRTSGNRVQVQNGLFSVMLGDVSTLTNVNFNQTLYLGVEIGGISTTTPVWDGEMSPRKILGAVPAAFEAENAQTLAGIATTSFLRSDEADTMQATSSSPILSIIQNGVGKVLALFSGVTEVFTVLSSGNIGIGTTTPYSTLTLADSTSATGGIALGSDVGLYRSAASQFSLSLGGAERMRWALNGGVGQFQMVGAGTAAAPKYSWTGDTSTGMYMEGTGLGFATAGTNRITVTSAGRVGIGTTTPGSTLSVVGDLRLTGSFRDTLNASGTVGQILSSTGIGTSWVATSTLGLGNGTYLGLSDTQSSFTANRVIFTNSGGTSLTDSASFVFDGTNLGIGSTTPGSRLTVGGNAYVGGNVTSTGTVYTRYIESLPGTNLEIQAAAVTSGSANSVYLSGGNALFGGGIGGEMQAFGGTGRTRGGNFGFFGGSAEAGFDGEGGNLELSAGLGDGSGQNGTINLLSGLGTVISIKDNLSASQLGFFGATPIVKAGATADLRQALIDYGLYTTGGATPLNLNGGTLTSGALSVSGASTLGNASTTNLSVSGDAFLSTLRLTGAFRDGANASGTLGMILQTTGTSTRWVATSTLGFGDNTFTGLSDTQNSLTANRVIFTNSGGTSLTDSASLIFDGTNFGIGTSTPASRLSVAGTISVTNNVNLLSTTAGGAAGVLNIDGERFIHGYILDNTYGTNQFMGYQAGNFTLGSSTNQFLGIDNLGVGRFALGALTTGSDNTVVGQGAMQFTTTGYSNIAMGRYALQQNITGNSNTALGTNALMVSTSSSNNTAVGNAALADNTAGQFNTAVGSIALVNNTLGEHNTAVGYNALDQNTTGNYNVAIGGLAVGSNSTSWGNVGIGYYALNAATGGGNIGIGRTTGSNIVDGENNTIIGNETGLGIVTGDYNTILGANVSGLSSSLSNNIIIADGQGNRRINVDSNGNVGIGTTTPSSRLTIVGDTYITGAFRDGANASGTLGMILQTTGTSTRWVATSTLGFGDNTFTGLSDTQNSLTANRVIFTNSGGTALTDASNFTFDGTNLGFNATTGIAFGGTRAISADPSNGVLRLGGHAGTNNTGTFNSLIGNYAGYSNTGSYNELIGYQAGYFNQGVYNQMLGYEAGYNLRATSSVIIGGEAYRGGSGTSPFNATNNVALGYRAGYAAQAGSDNNILLGYRAADNLTTGNNNIIIGYDIDNVTATADNRLNIGNLIFGTGLDGTGTTLASGNVGIGTSTPNNRLTVVGTGSSNPFVVASSTGDSLMTVLHNGYVGMGYGIDDPSTPLYIRGPLGDLITLDSGNGNNVGTIGYNYTTTGLALSSNNNGNVGTINLTDYYSAFTFGGQTRLILGEPGLLGLNTVDVQGVFDVRSSSTTIPTILAQATSTQTASLLELRNSAGTPLSVFDVSGRLGIGTTTPSSELTVVGGMRLTGAFRDGANASGTLGMVLQTTGTSTRWVATSTLGIGGVSTFLALTDTPSSFTANRIMYTNSGATALIDSADLTFNGTNLGLGNDDGISFGGTRMFTASSSIDVIKIGREAGLNSTSSENIFIGYQAGYNNYGENNIMIGQSVGFSNSGNDNVLVGGGTYNQSDGSTIIGHNAGQNNTGGYSALVGTAAGQDNTGANLNALGFSAGENNTGSRLVAVGYYTGQNNTGDENNAIGFYAGGESTGDYNNMFGSNAGAFSSGSFNNIIGFAAGASTTGSFSNFFGAGAGYRNSGNYNEFIGLEAAGLLQASATIAIGSGALRGGSAAVNVGTPFQATNNTAIGFQAGYNAQTGANNNVLLGYRAADNLTTGNNNIIIGYDIDNITATADNVLNIGNLIFGTGLDGTGTTLASGNVGIGTSTPASKLSIAGDIRLTGAFRDGANASGTLGMILQTTGTSTRWVATSTLGIGGGATTFLALTDTPSSYTANRIMYTNSGATALVDSADFTFNGTDLALGSTTGIAFGGERVISASSTIGAYLFGYRAGESLTGASDSNILMGALAGRQITTGGFNIGIGTFALAGETDGSHNTALGYAAGSSVSSGYANSFLGAAAGDQLRAGNDNSFIGAYSAFHAATSSNSVALGTNAAFGNGVNYQASNFTVIGRRAGYNMATGADNNILLGYQAADNLTTGNNNIIIGYDIDNITATADNVLNIGNLIFGTGLDGTGTTLSSGNVGIGTSTPGSKLTVAGNVSVTGNIDIPETTSGGAAGVLNVGSDRFIHTYALDDTYGDNIFMGRQAGNFTLGSSTNQFIGLDNVGIGSYALSSLTTGGTNTAVGQSSMSNTTTGGSNTALGFFTMIANTTGADNTAIGRGVLASNTTGRRNTALGVSALENSETGEGNIALGAFTADNLTTGNNNIIIGYDIDAVSASADNTLNIGNLIFGTGVDGIDSTLSSGNVGIGTTTPGARLAIERRNFNTAGTAGLEQYFTFTNSTPSAVQFGNNTYLYATTTATTTIVGNIFRLEDSTTFGNTVRGLEVQTDRGNNTRGENTALSGFARTFGVRGTTAGDAGGTFEPAGVYGETQGTTQGNALRGYSSTITTAALLKLFQDTSTYVGTGLLMNFGNGGGSFSSTTASKYIDLQNAGTSLFTVGARGMTTIGDGTTNNNAGLQIGYGGICVDNDGSCNASTTGRISAVSYHTGNSDLAEMYFSNESLKTGEIVYLKNGLSIGKASEETEEKVIGVVTTKPGLLLGFDDSSLSAGEEGYGVALAGRVPVRLSNENGEIKAGDELMLSSVPGVAMKASSTGMVVGIALEDFEATRAYSDTYINQFGDDLVDPVVTPINKDNDPRINDGCYYGAGSASGEAPCVPLIATSTDGQAEEAQMLAEAEAQAAALAALKNIRSERVTLDSGEEVRVGQIVMFVSLNERFLDEEGKTMIAALVAGALDIEGEVGEETVWNRLVTLANNFVDGVLSILTLKADRVEVKEEICVDGVCLNAEDLRRLLDEQVVPQEPAEEPSGEEPAPDEEVEEEPSGEETNDGEVAEEETPPPLEEPIDEEMNEEVVEETTIETEEEETEEPAEEETEEPTPEEEPEAPVEEPSEEPVV